MNFWTYWESAEVLQFWTNGGYGVTLVDAESRVKHNHPVKECLGLLLGDEVDHVAIGDQGQQDGAPLQPLEPSYVHLGVIVLEIGLLWRLILNWSQMHLKILLYFINNDLYKNSWRNSYK